MTTYTTGSSTVTWGTGGGNVTWGTGGGNVTRTSGTGGGGGAGGGASRLSAACRAQGCRAEELQAMLASTLNVTQELLTRKEAKVEPTRSLWCEQGGHSFSEKGPDLQVLTIQGKDKEGKPVSESRTICGPCAAKTKVNLGSARNAPVTELQAAA